MTELIIYPKRKPNEPQLPPMGLLFINPSDIVKAGKLLQKQKAPQYFFFNSNLFITPQADSNSFFVAGPAVGAPMAVLALEKLIALGAKQIIVYGTCGALDPALKIGDILLPTWGISEEGTSHHYPAEGIPQSSSTFRNTLRTSLLTNKLSGSEGPIWTTDAPYRESYKAVKEFVDKGVQAVDMEFTALCTVAAFRKIKIVFAMLVSDELYHKQWRGGFGSKTFKRKNTKLINTLIDISPL